VPDPHELLRHQQALDQVLRKFLREHPTLNTKDPATEILAMVYVSRHQPKLMPFLDWFLGEQGYITPRDLVREYESGVPMTDLVNRALRPLADEVHR
jgi:hypothetical protein